MNLLIDIGNTNLRWATQEPGRLGETRCVRHGGGVPLDLLAAWESHPVPQRVLLAAVGRPEVAQAVARVVHAYWGLDAETLATRAECLGVRVAYVEPSRLGVDRWLTLLAVHGEVAGASLILDAGTAATYDLLLADGRHLGGLILPGLAMMRDALLEGTQIPRESAEPTAEPWATDTGAAVAVGGVQALSALADRLYDRLSALSEPRPLVPPTLWLTGGDAQRLSPALGRPSTWVPDLVLRGLQRLIESED